MKRNALINKTKQYARIANQRLRNIEKNKLEKSSNAYKYVEQLAYDKLNVTYNNQGRPRFLTAKEIKKLSDKELKKYEKTLTNFLEAKTSTVGGVKRKYEKSYKTYTERYGNIDFDTYTEMYDNDWLVKYQRQYASQELRSLVTEFGIEKAIEIAKEVYETAKILGKESLSLEEINKIKERMRNYD